MLCAARAARVDSGIMRLSDREDDDCEKVTDQIMAPYLQYQPPSLHRLWAVVEKGENR